MQVGKLDEAVKQADAAIAQAPVGETELKHRLLALKTHFATLTTKAGKPDAKDTAATAARVAAQHILTAKLTGDAAKAMITDAWKRADPDPTAVSQALPALELSLLAWSACVSGNAELAESLAARVSLSQDLRPRVWADLVRAQQSLKDVPDNSLAASAVAARLDALEQFEQCIDNFRRLQDIDGLHASCRF